MIYKLIKFLCSKDLRTFLISSLFHFSLYFSTSNKILLLFSLILLIALYQHLKKLPLTLFYVFLLTLPFAKGKGIDILLLDKKYILKNAIFNIEYLFPFYLSSFYLGLFYLHYLRRKLYFKNKKIFISKNNKVLIGIFLLFIVSTASNSIFTMFDIPVFLSSIQLVILLSIFLIPFILHSLYKKLDDFSMVIASSTLFQSVWLILQTINQGHLNKDIEVFLFSNKLSVTSSENSNLLRLPGTFFESSILGTFLLTNVSILTFVFLSNKIKDKKKRKIISIASILGLFAILLTGSRAIYLISLLLLLIILKTKTFLFKKKIKNVFQTIKKHNFFIPLVIIGILFVSPYLINRLGSSNQLFSKEGSGTYRIQLSQYSLRLLEKKPLLGVGLNLSPYYLATSFPQEDYFVDPSHPHNLLIQLLAETGIIGTILFSIFIYLIFRPVIKNNFSKYSEFHLAAFIFFLCAQVYPIFINHMEIISYLFLYLGFAAHQNQIKQK